jgi:hypothetical protein
MSSVHAFASLLLLIPPYSLGKKDLPSWFQFSVCSPDLKLKSGSTLLVVVEEQEKNHIFIN